MTDLWKAVQRGAKKARQKAAATGRNLDDMLFDLSGENIQSVQDFNASGKVMPFVCIRTSIRGAIIVPKSVRRHCDGCRAEVWMSPGTREMFDKVKLKVIVCMECFEKMIAEKRA